MAEKPKCSCWTDQESKSKREIQIDGIERAIQQSVMQACEMMGICNDASEYVAGAVMAGLVFWAAYSRRGDGQVPTMDEIKSAGEQIVLCCRERLEGARLQDLDRMTPPSDRIN
jgi:hypothetical protein